MKEYSSDIENCMAALRTDGVILYPTDTIWGLGCMPSSSLALEKIYSMKNRPESKNFILLLDHESKLMSFVDRVPDQAWPLIEHSERPLTIIYENAKNLPESVIASDGSVAIRIVRDDFCRELIRRLKQPLISTSANLSGQPSPASFADIDRKIVSGADYVVQYRREEKITSPPSVIVRLGNNGRIEFIRR